MLDSQLFFFHGNKREVKVFPPFLREITELTKTRKYATHAVVVFNWLGINPTAFFVTAERCRKREIFVSHQTFWRKQIAMQRSPVLFVKTALPHYAVLLYTLQASLELLKVIAEQPADCLKNCFLNLALPMMVLSQPGPPPKTKIRWVECRLCLPPL